MAGPEQYCTLFDRNYLPRALVLYRSLERECDSFVLRALCMDDETQVLLERLSLPHLRTISLADLLLDDPELAAVRGTRTSTEFCWTCTPAICRFVLRAHPELGSITYLDADLRFLSPPAALHAELGDGSIQLVPHNAWAETSAFGTYNVGWLTFRNDQDGRSALDWWRARCIEWCYERHEPERYGDQKYLDDWPTRFGGVRVTGNPAAAVDSSFDRSGRRLAGGSDGTVLVDGAALVYCHHAGLRVHAGDGPARLLARISEPYRETMGLVWTVLRPPLPAELELLWLPYLRELGRAHAELAGVGAPASLGLSPMTLRGAATQVARQRTPEPARAAYRRALPLGVRGRIGRRLNPR